MAGSRFELPSKSQRKLAESVAWGHLVACYFHTVAFLTWLVVGLVANAENDSSLLSITLELDEENKLEKYDLFWTAVWVPLIAAVFHGLQFHNLVYLFKKQKAGRFAPTLLGEEFGIYPYYVAKIPWVFTWIFLRGREVELAYNSTVKGVNLVRWIEYSISASFLTWNVVVLSGIVNVWAALAIAVLGNVILQYTGLRTETSLSNAYQQKGFQKRRTYATTNFYSTWLWFGIGSLVFIAQWIPIIVVFYQTVAEADSPVPDFVFALIWIIFGLYLLFPLVILAFYFISWFKSKTFYSFGFIVLSFVSKAALDGIIIIGAITEREE